MIDTSIIKSIHWSSMFDQINCPYFMLNISYEEFWEQCNDGSFLLYFIFKEGSTSVSDIITTAEYIVYELKKKYIELNNVIFQIGASLSDVNYVHEIIYQIYRFLVKYSDKYFFSSNLLLDDISKIAADVIRATIKRPTKLYDEFNKVLKLKAFW